MDVRGPLRGRLTISCGVCLLSLFAAATNACAQGWSAGAPAPSVTARLNGQGVVASAPSAAFGPPAEFASDYAPTADRAWQSGWVATTRQDLWREGEGFSDRVRVSSRGALRRADGSPLPPTGLDAAEYEVADYDVRFTRGFTAARGYTPSGLEVALIPHAGFGVGSGGGSAEAGATLKIGQRLDSIAPDGKEAFGDRARWYVYAAGSGRAVGYNFARTRDGDYARSGISHDSGSFLGDASIGVAMRKGDVQTSFGIVYRELEAEGLRGGEGFDRDVTEGLVAFQLSIKPE